MKVGIHIAHWQRLELFDLVLGNLRRVEYDTGLTLEIGVAGPDDPTDRHVAERNGARYIGVPNSPLGAKCNAAVKLLEDCDVLLGLGSDDIIDANALSALALSGADLAGVLDIYLYDLARRDLYYWPGYQCERRRGETTGPGRCVSRRLMDALGWAPFAPELDCNLDRSMFERLRGLEYDRYAIKLEDCGGMIVDIKTATNINPMPHVLQYANGLQAVPQAWRVVSDHFGADLVEDLHEIEA